jgi:hypothetical protein
MTKFWMLEQKGVEMGTWQGGTEETLLRRSRNLLEKIIGKWTQKKSPSRSITESIVSLKSMA